MLKVDDLTYTHITARPQNAQYFYILAFGNMFDQASINNLIKVDIASGQAVEGDEAIYNKTGYTIHSAIYKKRDDINAIFHLHTTNSIAVSAMECGLLFISQFSMPFFEDISYHNYNSLALKDSVHGGAIADDLGQNKNMLMRGHGTINCGKDLQEAFFYTRFLQQACDVQVAALSSGKKIITIDPTICKKAKHDMLNFEKNLGERDWKALTKNFTT